jgi:nitrate reductase gamma subunit
MDVTEAILMLIAFALAVIVAVLGRSFVISILLIGIFLVVVGLLNQFGVIPVIDAHLNVSVENADALFVLVGIVAFYAALAGAYFLWKRKRSKEQESSDMLPPMLEE